MSSGFEGYRYFHEGHYRGYALAEHFEALQHVLTTRDGCAPVHGEGRGGLHRFVYPGGDAFLRVYRRGGAVRHVIRETYFLQNRALAEFRIHHYLQQVGLTVPPLLGAVWQRIGPGYRGAIATHALVGETLLVALKRGGVEEGALRDCGVLVRGMHEYGVFHADLNAANIFLTETGPYLLDFDKARLTRKTLSATQRGNNLARLHRSLKKHGIPDAAFRQLEDAYYGRTPS